MPWQPNDNKISTSIVYLYVRCTGDTKTGQNSLSVHKHGSCLLFRIKHEIRTLYHEIQHEIIALESTFALAQLIKISNVDSR